MYFHEIAEKAPVHFEQKKKRSVQAIPKQTEQECVIITLVPLTNSETETIIFIHDGNE
jgi:hypothetical protein